MPKLGMSYVGVVMPFSTCLAVAPSEDVCTQLRCVADKMAKRIQLCGKECSGAKLGDWPVVRTRWGQHIFLWSGDKVIDQSGDVQYQLDFIVPTYDWTDRGAPKHKGLLLQHSFYYLPGLGTMDSRGWCSWTRTGWPHEPVLAAQASEALRRALRKDTKITIPDSSLSLGAAHL